MEFVTNYTNMCSECHAVLATLAEVMPDSDDPEAPLMYASDHRMLCGGRVCGRKEVGKGMARPFQPSGYLETDRGHDWIEEVLEKWWWFHDVGTGLYIHDPAMPDDPVTEFDSVGHEPTRKLWYAVADYHIRQRGRYSMAQLLKHLREKHARHIAQVPRDRREWTGEAFAIKWS